MKTRYMDCWGCFYSEQMENDDEYLATKDDIRFYVICRRFPQSVLVSPYPVGLDAPDYVCHPYQHYCGMGSWMDEKTGAWVGLIDAEDSREAYLESHGVGEKIK